MSGGFNFDSSCGAQQAAPMNFGEAMSSMMGSGSCMNGIQNASTASTANLSNPHGISSFEDFNIRGSPYWDGKGYMRVINCQLGQGVVLSSDPSTQTCQVQFADGEVLEMRASDLSLHSQHRAVSDFQAFMASAQSSVMSGASNSTGSCGSLFGQRRGGGMKRGSMESSGQMNNPTMQQQNSSMMNNAMMSQQMMAESVQQQSQQQGGMFGGAIGG